LFSIDPIICYARDAADSTVRFKLWHSKAGMQNFPQKFIEASKDFVCARRVTDMNQIPYRGSKSIRHHPTKFSRQYSSATDIFVPLF